MQNNFLTKTVVALQIFALVLVSIPDTALASGNGSFGGGDGSVGNPYQITGCLDLQAAGNNLGANYILSNDIDCSATYTWNSGAGFAPIGSAISYFTGEFNGNGHVITSLYINRTSTAYVGFISFLGSAGSVHDLGLVDASVSGNAYTGAMFGQNIGGTIARVFVTGSVSSNSYAGGLIGMTNGGTITDAYSRATLVGGGYYQGGLIGLAVNNGVVDNAYATGQNTAPQPRGLVGNNGSGTYTDSFYDSQTTGASDDASHGKPKTTLEMTSVATFTTNGTAGLTTPWDFVGNPNNDVANNNIWNINASLNGGYPYLSWQTFDTTAPTITNVTSNTANGSYKAGSIINVQITFSEVVVSTGSITVTLETGVTDQTCTTTVFNSATASCNYTVQDGDATSDLTVKTISGTLRDAWGNSMSVFTPTTNLAANKAIAIDTVAPIITLTGAATQSILASDTYTDAGATASDDIDGNITASITQSAFDPRFYGTYTRTYTVYDTAGNTATTRRTITVIGISNKLAITPQGIDGAPLDAVVSSNDTHTKITFNADNSVSEYSISENPDFTNSVRLPYIASVTLEIPRGTTKHLYIKFYSPTGIASDVIERVITNTTASGSDSTGWVPTITPTSTPKDVVTPGPIVIAPTPTPVTTPTRFNFTRNLKKGMTGNDVLELQKYLNAHNSPVSDRGIGSTGNETNYYGSATVRAVQHFQELNAAKILTPLGLTKGTGQFLTATRSIANSQ